MRFRLVVSVGFDIRVIDQQQRRIGWGVVSTGNIARSFSGDLALLEDEAALIAVSSRNAERAQSFAAEYGFSRSYGSVAELAADPVVDVVYIGSVHHDHLPAARICLEAGKSALVEKPLTTSAADTAELISIAERTGGFLMEAMWTRIHPLIRRAAEVVAAGEIGDIRHVSAGFGFNFDGPDDHRLLDPVQAGGVIWDCGVYPVHAVNLFLGEPAGVLASVSPARTGVDGHAAALLTFPARGTRPPATAAVLATMEVELPSALEVFGSAGRIMITDFFLRPETMIIYRDGAELEACDASWPGEGYCFEIREVERCLRAGEQESALVPWADTLAVARTLDAWRAALNPAPKPLDRSLDHESRS